MVRLQKIQALYAVLSRLSKREKIALYCAVFFISLTLLDRLIIDPVYSKMKSLDEDIQDKESGIKKNLRILAHKDRILTDTSKYNVFLDDFKSEEEAMSSMLKEIENFADKSEIYLVDMKPRGLRGVGSSNRYEVTLTCEAQMEQFADFIYKIESSDALLTIEQYQISPKSKDSSVGRCKMTISTIVVP
jgi:cell division protein FtsL